MAMRDITNCKSLNDLSRLFFGKANYNNREKVKKKLAEEGIDWQIWLKDHKENKQKKFCLICGKELKGKDQKKFCSTSCAAKKNNLNRVCSVETRKKISETLQKRSNGNKGEVKPLSERSKKSIEVLLLGKVRYCKNCGKILQERHQTFFCCRECFSEYRKKQYIEKWKNGETNGTIGEYGISKTIRKFLLEKRGYRCELCGWGEKNEFTGKIPLEIHHKDGNFSNNKEDNLQVLCPNCHSLTETYKSHNKNGRKSRKKYYKPKDIFNGYRFFDIS